MRTSVRPWLIGLGVLPLTLALSGCFGGPSLPGPGAGPGGVPDDVDDELVEDIIEGGAEGVDFESGELPADFPVDEVPLVDGEPTGFSMQEGTSWLIVVNAPDEATAESATSLLEAAGYSNPSGFAWENESYLVIIVLTEELEDGRWAVQYQVQKK